MPGKFLIPVIAMAGALSTQVACVGEHWTTPADELKTTLSIYKDLKTSENSHFQDHGSYADFAEIQHSSSGGGVQASVAHCRDGYCSEISASRAKYTIQIFPEPGGSGRHLSLFADETGIVRSAYGSPKASRRSPPLTDEELRRFGP